MVKRNSKGPKKETFSTKTFRQKSNWKILSLLIFMALLFILIIIKLLFINLFDGEELTRRALKQLTSTEVVKAQRGIIYDRNKKELAVNITKANIYYNMAFDKNKYSKEDKDKKILEDATSIASILEISVEDLKEKMTGDKVVKLASEISREKALALRELKINNLSIEDVQKRFYPFKNLGAYVIGFVNSDGDGQYGIESKYDYDLSGISGKRVSIKNVLSSQIPLTEEESYAPKDGLNPVLTMDEIIQSYSEEAANKTKEKYDADGVSVIVQDSKTGEILAMASSDSYDLNNPKSPVTDEQKSKWDTLTNEEKTEIWFKNWTNFNVNSQYEPGSTFKLITAAAALEEAKTYPNKVYYCPGVLTDLDRKIACTSKHVGEKTMETAIEESCNITFVKIGRELGKDKLYEYIKSFGFGEKTGIDLPAEANGQIPKSSSTIGPVQLATLSYGHGIAVTPIQLVNAVSAIVNGGHLNTPRIVDSLVDDNGNVVKKFETEEKRRVISENTSKTMRYLMKQVVANGTGRRAQVEGYEIGGKTGTAMTVNSSGTGYDGSYIASFLGVAPINDPKITVLVVVRKPKNDIFGGSVAAPCAQEIMENTLEYLDVKKTVEVKKDKSNEVVSVPNVINKTTSDAGYEIVNSGLTFNTNSLNPNSASIVIRQTPQAGTEVKKGTIVDLYVNDNKDEIKIMPNLVGKDAKDAISILKELNIEYNMLGTGKVERQSISPGKEIKEDSTLILNMSIVENTKTLNEEKNLKDNSDKENTEVENEQKSNKKSKTNLNTENNKG